MQMASASIVAKNTREVQEYAVSVQKKECLGALRNSWNLLNIQ